MVYLEHSGSRFWLCDANGTTTVTTSFGKIGMSGRTMTKKFKTKKEANEYVKNQVKGKREAGYDDAKDPNAKSGQKKRKTKSKNTNANNNNSSNNNNNNATIPFDVDSGVALLDAMLASRVSVHELYHARLALVNPTKNIDQFFILQLLVDNKTKKQRGRKAATSKPSYYVFARWGNTGSVGETSLTEYNNDEASAVDEFEKLFKQKVGVVWDKSVPGTTPKRGKFEHMAINNNETAGNATANNNNNKANWFYYLRNDPLGKADGWYAYDECNKKEVELLFGEYVASNSAARLGKRLVQSATSGFTYEVNLVTMTQTNTTSGTSRPIERSEDGTIPTRKPTKAATKAKAATTTTHTKQVKTQKKKTQTKRAATPIYASHGTSKSRPTRVTTTTTPTAAGCVDGAVSLRLQGGAVFGGYDCMLNQTNLGFNNNKFYKIQLVQVPTGIYLFTKWGRVGENGSTQELGPMDSSKAIKEFEKKFRQKTLNSWDERHDFVTHPRKYTLVEIESDEDAINQMAKNVTTASSNGGGPKKIAPCKLDKTTKGLVDLVFDVDMFQSAMVAMNIDPNKLPLGALSKTQIQKGYDILERLHGRIEAGANRYELEQITSEFYTTIPHAFGRSRGPVLTTLKMVEQKFEMLNTLTDIESAQAMQKKGQQATTENNNNNNDKSTSNKNDDTIDHPSDLNYKQLSTDLGLVQPSDKDYNIIERYWRDTASNGNMKLRNIWRVDRHNESQRFEAHDDLDNRKLLWHGTNVAVVAAILKSGLRIMPHSGGRVGRGIYLADQHQKSEWYVCPAKGTAIMFLVEAALGKQNVIHRDDSSLQAAPKGYHSVLAEGRTAPLDEVEIEIDGKKVMVPQGTPNQIQKAMTSSFDHNEFLIYKESQHRIRYILAFDV